MNKEIIELKQFIETEPNLLQEFFKKIKINLNFVIWGMGDRFKYIKMFCEYYKISPKLIIESDVNKQEKIIFDGLGEFNCINPSAFYKEHFNKNYIFFISPPTYYEEIRNNLNSNGVNYENCYCFDLVFCIIYWNYCTDYDIYRRYLLDNINRINTLYNRLFDDYSKETVISVIKGRLTCNYKYFKNVFKENQYYIKDVIQFSDEETVIELGSYNGDNILEFMEIVNRKYKKFICFEPQENEDLVRVINKEKINGGGGGIIEFHKKGAWIISDTILFFQDKEYPEAASFSINQEKKSTTSLNVVALDDFISERVTFIKADIEGAELMALKGAEKIIRKYRPKLAICVYHKHEDILEIFEYIESLNLNYKYHIRHHGKCTTVETVLYCIPNIQ